MNTYKHTLGQEILLQWFNCQPYYKATFEKTKSICKIIANDISENDLKNSQYKYLFPLVSIGLLEYHEKGFTLAPSIFLLGENSIIGINIPELIQEKLNIKTKAYSAHLIRLSLEEKKNIPDSKIPFVKFDKNILKKISPFIEIIKNWEVTETLDINNFDFLSDRGWISSQRPFKVGVYKHSINLASRRYLYFNESWYHLDSDSNNSTSQDISFILGKVVSGKSLFKYYETQKKLKIDLYHFPKVIIRCLVHLSEFNIELNESEIILNDINYDSIKQLNKILSINQL